MNAAGKMRGGRTVDNRRLDVWPVFLSLFMPGIGQLVQRRWIGFFYMFGFMGCLIPFLLRTGRFVAAYYRMAFDWNADPQPVAHFIPTMLLFWVALALHVVNLVDVAEARRAARRAAELRQHEDLVARLKGA